MFGYITQITGVLTRRMRETKSRQSEQKIDTKDTTRENAYKKIIVRIEKTMIVSMKNNKTQPEIALGFNKGKKENKFD